MDNWIMSICLAMNDWPSYDSDFQSQNIEKSGSADTRDTRLICPPQLMPKEGLIMYFIYRSTFVL